MKVICFTNSAYINVNLISKNTVTERSRIMFNQLFGYHSLAKLTHKNDYHKERILSNSFYKVNITLDVKTRKRKLSLISLININSKYFNKTLAIQYSPKMRNNYTSWIREVYSRDARLVQN